jgi:hypothetical protein
MKTVGQVITYLEMELTDAYEMHDEFKGHDKQQALFYLIKATTILELLEGIRG